MKLAATYSEHARERRTLAGIKSLIMQNVSIMNILASVVVTVIFCVFLFILPFFFPIMQHLYMMNVLTWFSFLLFVFVFCLYLCGLGVYGQRAGRGLF